LKKITLFGFIFLAVMMVVLSFAACAQQAAAPTTTVTKPAVTVTVTATPAPTKPTFTVLDPRAVMAPIPFVGLSPRLTTLDGKKIGVVNMGGGNYQALEKIAPAVQKLYPKCIADYLFMTDSRDATQLAWIKAHDAIILGNNY